ncbi:hypothetical protein [uncultured Cohaesibacter sp.]|uniref:hypothetical protein n=1 Tax=uncultured Cohaesibacter sp. TaxID=1002546 RepID=UPI0029C68182|nr:hypothetical protein [uncultured Cohaesibacter sp.]
MITSFPQQPAPPLAIRRGFDRPKLSVRGLAYLMSRRMILANLTDQPISLAQFNCLMAEHAPERLKQMCLMHQAAEAVCDPLLAIATNRFTTVSLAGADTRFPDFAWLFPDHFAEMLFDLDKLVTVTINTITVQLSSGLGDAEQFLLPVKRKIKPLPPEDAAWQWAETMEKLLAQPVAKAG